MSEAEFQAQVIDYLSAMNEVQVKQLHYTIVCCFFLMLLTGFFIGYVVGRKK